MCEIIGTTIAAGLAKLGIGATAAGATAGAATAGAATAGAATAGAAFQNLGSLLAIGGSIYGGVSAYRTGKSQARAIGEQMATEKSLNAIKDQRARAQFHSQIRKQAAELAARGVSLDSPTAVLLGQEAAQEASFQSQAIRSEGAAVQKELTANQRVARARGTQGLLKGGLTAAGTLLDAAPDFWPELLA